MPAKIDEIAADVFRLSVYVPQFNLEFNSFLVRDDEPLLFHTGMRQLFPEFKDAVSKLIELDDLRWISWSHFESDECGALNYWLAVAPSAEPVCSTVGALVNLSDFASKPARFLEQGESFVTGRHKFRYISTPHVPHGWDAGVLFEETGKTLFCSDLFHQEGESMPITRNDIIDSCRNVLIRYETSPFASYLPYNHNTDRVLNELADLKPRMLAAMHGSSYNGDCSKALRSLNEVFREVLGTSARPATAA